MMTATEQKLKALVLGPQDYRSSTALNVLGEPGLTKLAGSDTDEAIAVIHLTVPKFSGPPSTGIHAKTNGFM